MGALFDYATFPVENTNLENEFNAAVEVAQYDHGHAGCSGTLAEARVGLSITSKIFENRKEAVAWISDQHDKFRPCLAVKYKTTDGSLYWAVGGWMSYDNRHTA